MYDTTQIQDAIAAHMPRMVDAIQAAERIQSMTAYMQIDMASAVEAFCEALLDDATFYQSRTNDPDLDDNAESDARHAFSKNMAQWRIREYGLTAREIRRVKAETIREILAARQVAL